MMKDTTQAQIQRVLEVASVDRGSRGDQVVDHQKTLDLEAQDLTEVDPRWVHAYRFFSVLKCKIATTLVLRYFDPDRRATVVLYARSLMQEYDKIYHPVVFASRTLKANELNYGIAEKEVLALLRILRLNYNALVGRPIHYPRRKIQAPIPTIGRNEDQYAVSFDGSACVKRGGGANSSILGKLPEWSDLTVNEAEYHVLLLCLNLLEDLDSRRLVICGDSNLVIRQVRGEIDCKAPGLTLLCQKVLDQLRTWADHELQRCGIEVDSEKEIQDLVTLNRLDEILVVKIEDETACVSAVTTRSKARPGVRTGLIREKIVRELWMERIRQAHDEESWISGLKKYLVGEIRDLIQEDAKVFGSIAINYEVDQSDLLLYRPITKEAAADRDKLMRLVRFSRIFCITALRVYRVVIKELVGSTIGSEIISTRENYTRAYSDMWENVSIDIGSRATYPFQIIAMDHIPSLPRSFNGNTELLIFVDLRGCQGQRLLI
ncbi:reverse transcriptase [Phytophthora megakarya]|uniref:Reverse transcriptase n=1 Tax=Phytophthora megakarya TaxID=4795 RepID=A0A225X1E5_9STRA|nr:reverse transcriptase [Phytophthora megakarya]